MLPRLLKLRSGSMRIHAIARSRVFLPAAPQHVLALAVRGLAARAGSPTVLAVATMDTKAEELAFAAAQVRAAGCGCELVDVSAAAGAARAAAATVSREEVAACHPAGAGGVLDVKDRGEAVGAMSAALAEYLVKEAAAGRCDAVLGLGGSGGTALIAPAMQRLPVGFPKVMVTTMASGDVSAYVGCSDVALVPSVVDVAGLNSISRAVLGNAARAVAGMAKEQRPAATAASEKPTVALTMFGVTTPCCDAVRAALAEEYEVLVFHATGAGGRALEKLAASGMLAGVLDLTTTEIADEVVGGVLSAGPERLDALAESPLPAVVSLGALDMVNFGAAASVPAEFASRKLHSHNAQITLMRTSESELREVARFIAGKLNKAKGPVALLLPEGGLSLIDVAGMPFHDDAAREVLFAELEKHFVTTEKRSIRRVPAAINDPAFSAAAVAAFREMAALAAPSKAAAAPKKPTPSVQRSPVSLPPAAPGPRDAILERLRGLVAEKQPIIGAGAGTGISAKFEEAGGADLIIVYNSGRFRMGGHGSLAGMLPFKDANAIMLEMGEEIMPVLKRTPLLAGVCGTDPFRRMDRLLEQVKAMGFAGVQNFPTVGLIDGTFRQNLEETGMSYSKEVNMIRAARGLGLLTTPYCFNEDDARAMAGAGADIVVAHMGLTTSGSIGAATAMSLDDSVDLVQRIANAARDVNPDVLVLCHGGPISMPEDAQYLQDRVSGLHGFYGASSMERLPVEVGITEQTKAFKALKV